MSTNANISTSPSIIFNPHHLPASLLAQPATCTREVLTSAYYDGKSFLLLRGDRALVLVECEAEEAHKLLDAWAQRRFDKLDHYSDEPEVLTDSQIRWAVRFVLSPRTL